MLLRDFRSHDVGPFYSMELIGIFVAWFSLGCKLNDSIFHSLNSLELFSNVVNYFYSWYQRFLSLCFNKLVSFSELFLFVADQQHEQPMESTYPQCSLYFLINRKNYCSEYQQTWFLFWEGHPGWNKLMHSNTVQL